MLTPMITYLNNIYPPSKELINELWNCGQIKECKKEEFLLKAGATANYTYWVLKGVARSYYLKEDEEITTKFIQEGAPITSIFSYYGRKPGNENIMALEDMTLACFHYDDMQKMYKNYPEFNYRKGGYRKIFILPGNRII